MLQFQRGGQLGAPGWNRQPGPHVRPHNPSQGTPCMEEETWILHKPLLFLLPLGGQHGLPGRLADGSLTSVGRAQQAGPCVPRAWDLLFSRDKAMNRAPESEDCSSNYRATPSGLLRPSSYCLALSCHLLPLSFASVSVHGSCPLFSCLPGFYFKDGLVL